VYKYRYQKQSINILRCNNAILAVTFVRCIGSVFSTDSDVFTCVDNELFSLLLKADIDTNNTSDNKIAITLFILNQPPHSAIDTSQKDFYLYVLFLCFNFNTVFFLSQSKYCREL
jgi:hypothetical protein